MRIALLALLVAGFGCQTQFVGSPHIDPATCQARCGEARMQMTGMVYMGEYSSACICEIPRAAPGSAAGAAAGASGAAAGVVMQMRRAQDQQNQHNMMATPR